jgi:hypothetical protein
VNPSEFITTHFQVRAELIVQVCAGKQGSCAFFFLQRMIVVVHLDSSSKIVINQSVSKTQLIIEYTQFRGANEANSTNQPYPKCALDA